LFTDDICFIDIDQSALFERQGSYKNAPCLRFQPGAIEVNRKEIENRRLYFKKIWFVLAPDQLTG
jgi:hypothetical protein